MSVHNHKKLRVWQRSMDLVDGVYELTRQFPTEETFGLSSQVRRCAVSIPANIAEGSHKSMNKDFCNFLYVAFGSESELETHLKVTRRQRLANEGDIEALEQTLQEVMKMLNKLIQTYKNDHTTY